MQSLKWTFGIFSKISLKFVFKVSTEKDPGTVEVMVLYRTGDKPIFDQAITIFTQRPQWVDAVLCSPECTHKIHGNDVKWRFHVHEMLECHDQRETNTADVISTHCCLWRHRSGSILAHIMACCLTAASHYHNQCWLIIDGVLLHSPKTNSTERARDIYS